jgi:hypothetical protein
MHQVMYKKSLGLLLLFNFLLFPGLAEAQAPALGTAASFVLFTADGAFNNVGVTRITGDIGTDVGSVTGIDQAGLVGQSQVENPASVQAATDVRAAYAMLSAATCGAVLDITLGGQTLTPSTYCTGAAATLDGVLTLDGQGDATSLFIINIGGALATGKAARVVLTNGAVAANVYWRIAGRFDLGEQAVFRGTVLADGAINLLDGATLFGRGLSRAGAISVLNSTVALQEAAPLPVVLTAFAAERQGAGTFLRWATASEHNSAYFEVQSSADGQQYATLGRVASQGQATQAHAYTWAESSLARYAAAVVYYRLRQVDVDGTSTYSVVRSVAVAALVARTFQAYPNPSQAALGVQLDAAQAGAATLRLTDALGHVVFEKQVQLLTGANALGLPEAQNLRPGYYQLHLQQGDQHQVLAVVRQ